MGALVGDTDSFVGVSLGVQAPNANNATIRIMIIFLVIF
jgi:hypothetical protein